jgi:beta-glucosidase
MVANHATACVEGFQSDGDLKNGIAATIKHFPGAGPDEDGKDSHSRYGKYNVFPGDNFEYHQIPFISVFQAGAAAVMPCYSIFKGQTDYSPEQTGAAFSKGLITDYMKRELGFNGMVTSDWGTMSSSVWGVESLTQPQRAAMFVKAGSHQLGSDSHTIVQAAYDQGLLTEEEINGAAEKILEMSFKLGIFENPYVDTDATSDIVRSEEHLLNGFVAQKKAIVILKNRAHDVAPPSGWGGDSATKYLPIRGDEESGEHPCDADGDDTVTVYFDGVEEGLSGEDIYSPYLDDYDYVSAASGSTLAIAQASTPADADIAVLRITARKGSYFGYDAGVPLSFDAPFPGTSTDGTIAPAIADRNKVIDLLRIRDGYTNSDGAVVSATNPDLKIILVMHMDRPGIVKPFINGLATLNETPGEPGSYPMVSDPANLDTTSLKGVDGFLVEFGAHDRAVLDVLFNQNIPTTPADYAYGASLPMEIPSSDSEVEAQYEDLPADTWNPTFALGAGSKY